MKNPLFKRPTIPPLSKEELAALHSVSKEEEDLPEKIGPYHIEALLNKGGMSVLYLATHPETLSPLIIKVLSKKFLSHKDMTARFLKEAEIIALADHPNIIKLYGYGDWEEGLYIAMEFVQGVSLRDYLVNTPRSLKRSLELVLEISYALCHLHTHGIIHRDLKPENILVSDTGHIKVIDFGIAQLKDSVGKDQLSEEEVEKKRRVVGTPVYMSPEQQKNPENVSYPSDIYSLGIIAYELVLGKLSFGRVYLSLMPGGLQKILAKALQEDAKDRYLDIVDFITDLSAYLQSPLFSKERKIGEQVGALFEQLQEAQSTFMPHESLHLSGLEIKIAVKRPFGFQGVLAHPYPSSSLIVLAVSSSTEVDSLIQLIFLKGALDASFAIKETLPEKAERLNQLLLKAPLKTPLALALLSWDESKEVVHFLSAGAGPLWVLKEDGKVESKVSKNPLLGEKEDSKFTAEKVALKSNMKVIICPESINPQVFPQDIFEETLKESQGKSSKYLSDFLLRKAKSLNLRYFDDHSFLAAVIQKGG